RPADHHRWRSAARCAAAGRLHALGLSDRAGALVRPFLRQPARAVQDDEQGQRSGVHLRLEPDLPVEDAAAVVRLAAEAAVRSRGLGISGARQTFTAARHSDLLATGPGSLR
ncbi:hypothetical protein CEE94_12365, partial [Lactobacillus crispatus]